MTKIYLLFLFSFAATVLLLRNKSGKDWVRAVLVAMLFLSAFIGGFNLGCHKTDDLLQNNLGYSAMGIGIALQADIDLGEFDETTRDRLQRKLALMEQSHRIGLRKVAHEIDQIDKATKTATAPLPPPVAKPFEIERNELIASMAMFNARALDHLNDKEYVRLRGFLTLQLYGSYDQYKRITNGAFSDEFTSHFEKRIPQIEATLKAAQTNLVNFNLSDLKSAIQNEIAK